MRGVCFSVRGKKVVCEAYALVLFCGTGDLFFPRCAEKRRKVAVLYEKVSANMNFIEREKEVEIGRAHV